MANIEPLYSWTKTSRRLRAAYTPGKQIPDLKDQELFLIGWKKCFECGEVKPHDNFHRSSSAWDDRNTRCKPCACDRSIQHRHSKPIELRREMYRNRDVKRYGIDLVEYNRLVEEQSGKCLVCKEIPGPPHFKLYIDHDHFSNLIRGLLCHRCNFLLGHARDRIDILQSAIRYLKDNDA